MGDENILDNLDEENETETKPENFSKAPELPPCILTNELKLKILKKWEGNYSDPPSIEELCETCWPGQKLDGRSKYGRLIKEFLTEKDLKPKTKTEYEKKGALTLTDEQKEYVRNNLNMKNHEIAQVLWEKPFLVSASQESRTVAAYREELRKQGITPEIEREEEAEKYSPPNTLDRACARINKNISGANYDFKNLSPTQKKCALSIIDYLNNVRFIHKIELVNNANDRKLLENTFVKYIYDKPDLTQEDLDQYLLLANESVMESGINRTIVMLEREQERSLDEDGKISMAIVEAIKTSRDELNACINRQGRLYKSLTEERSKRLSERVGPQFTLLNIVEEVKNEERRKGLLAEAEKRNDKIKGEIKRLNDFDDTICRIWGLDEDVVING